MKSKQYLKNTVNLALLLLSSAVLLNGCTVAQKPQPPFERTEAEQRIRDTFKNDFGLNTIVRSADNTLYIYIPTETSIIRLDKSMSFGGSGKKEPQLSFIHFDCEFKDNVFNASYATAALPEAKQFINNITYNYTLQTQEIMNKMYYMIYDSLSDRPGHYNFFKVIIADTKKGLEIKITFNETDLRKAIAGALPFFEFNRRVISEINGDNRIVGDTKGTHIDYQPIKLSEFICDLMIQYLRSGQDMVSDLTPEQIIQKRFYLLCQMYDFNEFLYMKTNDIVEKTESISSYDELHQLYADR